MPHGIALQLLDLISSLVQEQTLSKTQLPDAANLRHLATGCFSAPQSFSVRVPFPLKPSRNLDLGGGDRDRTDDLRLAKPSLSQLSYAPSRRAADELVGRVGLEPTTSPLSGVRSNHLSYQPIFGCHLTFCCGRDTPAAASRFESCVAVQRRTTVCEDRRDFIPDQVRDRHASNPLLERR